MADGSAAAVTAVVLARNEAVHLPDCLSSLQWAADLIVLDSGSTDDTVTIAELNGARVEFHEFENYSRQRQHALGLVQTRWVLFVDADERIPAPLADEIVAAASRLDHSAYWIPRHNYFWGRLISGGGWWPDYQLRLLEVERCRFDPDRAVHEVAAVDGSSGHLTTAMIHLNYDDWSEFTSKQAEYAELEAARRLAEGEIPRAHNFVLQPVREFWRRFWRLRGWKDGATGFRLCLAMAWFEFVALRHAARIARTGLERG
jgi:glycosyltransferase involved in cell wall biosynthesis